MLESEKMAIAAHLHVLLRRKIGRVTDVEWMIRSSEYAREILRVARVEREHADLQEWADKLEAALFPAVSPLSAPRAAPSPGLPEALAALRSPADGGTRPSRSGDAPAPAPQRYVGRLR